MVSQAFQEEYTQQRETILTVLKDAGVPVLCGEDFEPAISGESWIPLRPAMAILEVSRYDQQWIESMLRNPEAHGAGHMGPFVLPRMANRIWGLFGIRAFRFSKT
jgi:hypothetical protein